MPAFPTRISQQVKNIEVQLPPLVAGALVAAFAKALADGLNNELLTHYYLVDLKIRINLDRVVDRLIATFTRQLWDEAFLFYHSTNSEPPRQVKLLFDGPVRQLVLILNGPETAKCVLDKLGPGLSRRPQTWSANTKGIDLPLALQLLCRYWHREFSSESPGGSPEEIARTLHNLITTGNASARLISEIRKLLFSPHHVQLHLAESAVWDIIMKRPFRPPPDGFHFVQFKFEVSLLARLQGVIGPGSLGIGLLPAVTGTLNECIYTTVSEYVDRHWHKCGRILLRCLEEAITNTDGSMPGMSVWDGSDGGGSFCPGLKFIHLEIESTSIQVSVSAWTHTLTEVFQQMCWICAALSSSPFPGVISESSVAVSNWAYLDGSIYVDCELNHKAASADDVLPSTHQLPGASIANGFPPTLA